jgi:hypothetical protein
MVMGKIEEIKERKELYIKVIQISVPVICLLIMFGWTSIKGWGSNKAQDAVDKQMLCHKLDSICKDGIDKDIRDNTQEINIKDFKETMVEYAQRQEIMYLEVKDNQRLQTKILAKMDKKLNVASDLIEELKDKETAKEEVRTNNQ